MILDKIDKIKVDSTNCPINNLQALDYLKNGIFFLAEQIKIAEKQLPGRKIRKIKEYEKEIFPDSEYVWEEEIVGLDFSNKWNYINCIFHWFSISVVNYVRVVGLIEYLQRNNLKLSNISTKKEKEKLRNSCSKYVKKVIPEIQKFRNKIAAHFSATDPYEDENYIDWELSLIPTISSYEGIFEANGLTISINGIKNNELPVWSITKEFEKLKQRYW